jgi:hypothetical protein
MNRRSAGFDDDADLIVVAINEPIEGHRLRDNITRTSPVPNQQAQQQRPPSQP